MMNNSAANHTTMMMHRGYMHMTFFWGKDALILFTGWPGDSAGKYATALLLVFALAFLHEWLNHCRIIPPGTNHVVVGLAQTAMHTLRVGLSCLLMLAIMSFNGGVFLVAVAGHALGFLLFGSSVFRKAAQLKPLEGNKADLPSFSC